jgi:hypothetical protein
MRSSKPTVTASTYGARCLTKVEVYEAEQGNAGSVIPTYVTGEGDR